jgi:hypothetical protein
MFYYTRTNGRKFEVQNSGSLQQQLFIQTFHEKSTICKKKKRSFVDIHTILNKSTYQKANFVLVSELSVGVITMFMKHGNHANRCNCTTPQNSSPWRNISKLNVRYQLNDCLQARAPLITALHTCR